MTVDVLQPFFTFMLKRLRTKAATSSLIKQNYEIMVSSDEKKKENSNVSSTNAMLVLKCVQNLDIVKQENLDFNEIFSNLIKLNFLQQKKEKNNDKCAPTIIKNEMYDVTCVGCNKKFLFEKSKPFCSNCGVGLELEVHCPVYNNNYDFSNCFDSEIVCFMKHYARKLKVHKDLVETAIHFSKRIVCKSVKEKAISCLIFASNPDFYNTSKILVGGSSSEAFHCKTCSLPYSTRKSSIFCCKIQKNGKKKSIFISRQIKASNMLADDSSICRRA